MALTDRVLITGTGELDRFLRKFPITVQKKLVKAAVRSGGTILKNEMKRYAPYGRTRRRGTHLRDAILVKKDPRRTDVYKVGASYTFPKAAPHAHLVEYGTKKRYFGFTKRVGKGITVKVKRGHRVKLGSKWVWVKHSGKMTPHPFIKPAYRAKKNEAMKKMQDNLSAGIEREALKATYAGVKRDLGL